MSSPRPAIWLQPASPAPTVAPSAAPPRLSGPADAVQRVMARLTLVRDPVSGADLVGAGRVVALEIGPEEARLTLRIGSGHCDSAHHVAEEAFAVLRAELPDTDLYLRHVQATPCAPEPDAPL